MVATNERNSADPGDIGNTIIRYRRAGSTMDVAADLARRGAPHGTVVLADEQTAGRGRQGRTWSAAPGSSLLTSWILRSSKSGDNVGALSPLVALAVARAMRRIVPEAPLTLKWPNDVLIDGGKVAGILLTTRRSAEWTVVIAGIGINLWSESSSDAAERANISQWVSGITADWMLREVSASLGSVWRSFEHHNCLAESDLDAIHGMMAWRGELVTVTTGAGAFRGTATGIGSDGALLLQAENDPEITRMYVGDIVRGPRPV